MRDAIRLPVVLDLAAVTELRPRIELASAGASIVIDSAYLQQAETPGVQLLCALVLGAEGRGVSITWVRVPPLLVNYVSLLGIGDVLRFDAPPPKVRDARTDDA